MGSVTIHEHAEALAKMAGELAGLGRDLIGTERDILFLPDGEKRDELLAWVGERREDIAGLWGEMAAEFNRTISTEPARFPGFSPVDLSAFDNGDPDDISALQTEIAALAVVAGIDAKYGDGDDWRHVWRAAGDVAERAEAETDESLRARLSVASEDLQREARRVERHLDKMAGIAR